MFVVVAVLFPAPLDMLSAILVFPEEKRPQNGIFLQKAHACGNRATLLEAITLFLVVLISFAQRHSLQRILLR